MKGRIREKIVRAWYSGHRLDWKQGTVNEAFRPYMKPNRDGGWLMPRFAAKAMVKV